ncbi:MAG: pyridoxamine 5'-phosphate oxidase [Planctomycetes bacterium]|nr:pyridoxamine 5'-phosphate oxidase [Planctomycetota bacterium]
MSDQFSDLRIEYGDEPLRRADAPDAPWPLFAQWLAAAKAAGVSEPNAMSLATCDAAGQPSCRVVLCKRADERGLLFFTNLASAKGNELRANPRAAVTFWWGAPRNRQVRVVGKIVEASPAESDEYFWSRPRRAQLCSAASPQSQVVADRAQLEGLVADLERRVGDGVVPRPAHWGGYLLVPASVEFWQGRDGRLHDRLRYVEVDGRGGSWRLERLAP